MKHTVTCTACGTMYAAGSAPSHCRMCEDDRQFVPRGGQTWTTKEKLAQTHAVRVNRLHERFYELEVAPRFAIGQRAFLILSEAGNILWDCIPLLDEPTIAFIRAHGGLRAVAISHPHYYSNMRDWAETFDCPILIHEHDEEWIVDQGDHVNLWASDEKDLWDKMRLINVGGHFPGSTVLLAPSLSPDGTLFCGDAMFLSASMKHFSIMYSYPNRIPLPVEEARQVGERIESLPFDSIYGFWGYQNLPGNAREVLRSSLARYR
ncbi:MAG: MBL fold metallo-hydrolase [Planctomycetota bacterium]